jgi:tripartite-type tricarboxylate transporter receptor subunit TctC
MRDNVGWDPLKDFMPIMLSTSAPNVLAVNPSVPANSAQELIALSKTEELIAAVGPTASATYIGTELFRTMSGARIGHKIYSGNVPALNAVLAGESQMMFVTMGAAIPEIRAGRLRGLAVTGDKRFALLPDLPTVAECLPGFELAAMTAIVAPLTTPPAIIRRLNEEMARVLNSPEAKKALLDRGVDVVASKPDDLTAKVTSEMARLGPVIHKAAGIRD